ncbi:MAG: HAMP domain-containing histidine kinase [Lachnospiraceae bacterium]|nr:HAMP domain-containing histidine kinase [Lachnospiraceae bacterium]
MKEFYYFILFLCIFLTALFMLLYHFHTLRLMQRLEDMIDSAIDGSFTEQTFDESRLSALENKFAKYLSASETSYKNIAAEKNKINTLISDISHQTKTPVSNILLYSELLAEQNLTEESMQYVSSLTMQTEKLNFLIASLVKLSRLETGILTLSPKKTFVFPMMEKLLAQYTPPAEEKGLILSINNAEESKKDSAAIFDEKWTMEAIGNLIDNAIKYTEKGSITLSVKSYEMFLCIQVSDTGIGISESEQSKIFSRFYRAGAVHEKPGVGIGLFLTREIIMLENGYIKVSSNPGKGSVFSVYLPL